MVLARSGPRLSPGRGLEAGPERPQAERPQAERPQAERAPWPRASSRPQALQGSRASRARSRERSRATTHVPDPGRNSDSSSGLGRQAWRRRTGRQNDRRSSSPRVRTRHGIPSARRAFNHVRFAGHGFQSRQGAAGRPQVRALADRLSDLGNRRRVRTRGYGCQDSRYTSLSPGKAVAPEPFALTTTIAPPRSAIATLAPVGCQHGRPFRPFVVV